MDIPAVLLPLAAVFTLRIRWTGPWMRLVCVREKERRQTEGKRQRERERDWMDPDGRQRGRQMREGTAGIKGLLGRETFLSWHDTKWLKCVSECVHACVSERDMHEHSCLCDMTNKIKDFLCCDKDWRIDRKMEPGSVCLCVREMTPRGLKILFVCTLMLLSP